MGMNGKFVRFKVAEQQNSTSKTKVGELGLNPLATEHGSVGID